MKKVNLLLVFLLLLVSCTKNQLGTKIKKDNFTKEIVELQQYFHVPGLAVLVQKGDQTIYENYLGFADVEKQVPMSASTTIPMASLTKIFSGILIMQLVEEGKLSLDESISKYVTDKALPDSIKIKHVLSHTSQGRVGEHFYYSGRFSWLTQVIEKASGKSFEVLIDEKIINPLDLKNTILLKDSSQISKEKRQIAQPYVYDGKIKDGFIDYGYSAAAGIAATVQDLAILSQAFDKNLLMKEDFKQKMFTPFKPHLPYAYGIFSQKFEGEDLIWGYGQYDCYSSLFLKVPAKNLTIIIGANNNLLSDPARLIYGDVTYSLFALSFLKNFVLNHSDVPLFEDAKTLTNLESRINKNNGAFYLKKLVAQSLAEIFMANTDSGHNSQSKIILEQVFRLYPDYLSFGDLSLMHNLIILKMIAQQKEQVDFTQFDKQLEGIGAKLLTIDPNNPYANYYLANYYQSKQSIDSVGKFYNKILTAKNFNKNWYTIAAEKWVKENKAD